MKKIWGIVLVAVIVLGGAGFAAYWFLIRSEAEPRAKIEQTKVVESGDALDGSYTLAKGSPDSFVGYRVVEQLAAAVIETDATGRTSDVEGSLSIQGTTIDKVEITADLRTLTSDKPMRDNAIRTDGLESDRFPEATFRLTKPIQLDAVPNAGETVKTNAVGDFTLHGVTRSVTILIEGRWDGQRVQVVGNLHISFSDYGITAPTSFVVASVDDEGEMEFQLFFDRG